MPTSPQVVRAVTGGNMPPQNAHWDNRGVGISRLIPISGLIDDFALRPLDPTTTNDFYELVVERHKRGTTILTSNREPADWLAMTTDPMLAQAAVDRRTSGAHTLILEGPTYRQRTAIDRTTR
jgi:IstB-like ATP binding protein